MPPEMSFMLAAADVLPLDTVFDAAVLLVSAFVPVEKICQKLGLSILVARHIREDINDV